MPNTFVLGMKYALKEKITALQYWKLRQSYRLNNASLPNPQHDEIVQALRDDGGIVTSLRELDIPGTDEMMSEADELFSLIAGRASVKGGFMTAATREDVDRYPAIIRWGLNEQLLDMVEDYICAPINYRGPLARQDIKGGEQVETRLWHRDGEDVRIVKIIVYLNDVDRGGGAYEFIERSNLPISKVGPLGSRVDDAKLTQHVPDDSRRTCSGPRGTVVFSDTCSVYHRGSVAHSEARRAIFFSYNSKNPLLPDACSLLFDRDRFVRNAADLSERQLAVVGGPASAG